MQNKSWYGIDIIKEIKIKEISLVYSKSSLTVIAEKLKGIEDFLNLYSFLNYLKKKNQNYKNIFGIFYDNRFEITKKKIKNEFLKNLNDENFLFIMIGSNQEAYYAKGEETRSFIGIEMRYEEDFNESFIEEESEKDFIGIMGEMRKMNKKYFLK